MRFLRAPLDPVDAAILGVLTGVCVERGSWVFAAFVGGWLALRLWFSR